VWDETGNIPNHGDLKDELKTQTHPKYKGLHSQSSQRVLEELAEAFNSWKRKRKSDSRANPEGDSFERDLVALALKESPYKMAQDRLFVGLAVRVVGSRG
jgi:hypothetical protein